MKIKLMSVLNKHTLHPDTRLGIALVLFVIGLIGFNTRVSAELFSQNTPTCTQEARVCSDGSSVSRNGPACTFTPCPNDNLPNRPGITEEPLLIEPLPTPVIKESPAPVIKDDSIQAEVKEGLLCTQEVKLCSDGSYVGRTGPSCAFAPCAGGSELDR